MVTAVRAVTPSWQHAVPRHPPVICNNRKNNNFENSRNAGVVIVVITVTVAAVGTVRGEDSGVV